MDGDVAGAVDHSREIIGRLNELIRVMKFQALGPERILGFAAYDNWVKLHIPLAMTDVIQHRLFTRREFFEAPQLADIRDLITPDSVVLDAGANIGNHTVFFAHICKAKEVHAFEPTRVSFGILAKNIALNGLGNVRLHNQALGAGSGQAALARWVEHNTGGTVLRAETAGDYPVVSIDSLGLTQLDFLKIDVEGMQEAVLAGSQETLARCKPMIWVELRSKRKEFETGHAAMAKLGYKLIRKIADSSDDFLFGPA
ncbi:FkbM family methyltransferase [Siccirubricoccus sp. G192]|uniref:FkbM family methyltransferase n=1 Tax=Siccirubricoccus sp. G192 TaxID=2849651 RepID=UPI001C2C4F42|nr:FkbM family methyltransferase [Siccirubricoccus sp. G192]MBV1799402.1 FkbM family methyltransferase [Siccirubricoccus sp. G192]